MTIASTVSPAVPSQLIETTLRAAAGVSGMQLVFVSAIDAQTFTWRQLLGSYHGITAGSSVPLSDTFCGRLLAGAPPTTSDAASDAAYSDVPLHLNSGVTSYIGVPLKQSGTVTGTLGGLDASSISSSADQVRVMTALGRIVNAEASRDPDVRLRRTAAGWQVESATSPAESLDGEDLTVAMSLADLIVNEGAGTVPPQRPERPGDELSEVEHLRLQITQLEHALSARVVIEQAIGVLSQRFSVTPREAFDRLRKAARSRGQRVHELSVSIVQSARDDSVVLPAGLQ